jgi:Rps23 Pro-64 3,4-dihydroxylase Tpa1-like proline 4-hydroxylase
MNIEDIEVIYEPLPLLIIRNVFSKEENEIILKEAINNKEKYKNAITFGGKDNNFRSNKVAYYDEIYKDDRNKSVLLSKLDSLFTDETFGETLNSSPAPLNEFSKSNYHETQVSRYGDDGQFYKYHIDAANNDKRQLTMVYYMNTEPKEYEHGEIIFTKSPIVHGEVIDETQKEIIIEPENNMAVIFGSHTAHKVNPTISPEDFDKGRFSVNCWIGKI